MVDKDILMSLLRMKFNPSHDTTDNDEQMDLLQKFKKSVSVTTASQALPSGFVRHVDDGAYNSSGVKVDIIDLDEYADRKGNSITAPSTTYPVCYIAGGNIVTDPAGILPYTFWYYGENVSSAAPLLVLKLENGVSKYDSASSVELVWPEYMYSRIVMHILKYLGVSINDPNLVQEKLKEIADAA